ncbi:tRNA (adenosine(37)-N6)-threonylcarbamoyltransferase complex dimerization subunit type 1 TsaB [Micromonospora sp. DT81.3]|uniref:tRNA (adenosine(37)-N6)-threonylcarbamoyltransferase complex dimerization subunit type 1 TsaB n=1 Tax=Micromonospora sp. DT81.3 TaxID=3416523 RepID=UPI003CF589E3
MILAVDTSIGSTVVVVEPNGVVRGAAVSETRLGHAEAIGLLLERALAEASAAPADITHVVAGMGPGPFTGLRIGIAAARVFALARGVPMIPVASHDAAALAATTGAERDIRRTPFAVVTDARRREMAVSIYDGVDDDGMPHKLEGPQLRAAGTDVVVDELTLEGDSLQVVTSIDPSGLGLLAARAVTSQRSLPTSEPLYLRAPDVTIGHAPKRVGT